MLGGAASCKDAHWPGEHICFCQCTLPCQRAPSHGQRIWVYCQYASSHWWCALPKVALC